MDLLRRIASTALGETSALHASLPTRYAPVAAETVEADAPFPDEARRAGALPVVPAPPAEIRPAARAAPAAAPAAPAGARERPAAAPGGGPPVAPHLHDLRAQVSIVAPRDGRGATPGSAESATPRGVARGAEGADSSGPPPVRRSRPEPDESRASDAPLASSLVAFAAASRLAEARAPVIQVTIDRIEVRAPAPPPSRSERPASKRPEPARSLSTYLRGGAR